MEKIYKNTSFKLRKRSNNQTYAEIKIIQRIRYKYLMFINKQFRINPQTNLQIKIIIPIKIIQTYFYRY